MAPIIECKAFLKTIFVEPVWKSYLSRTSSAMKNIKEKKTHKSPQFLRTTRASAPDDKLRLLAFDNSLQANIITNASSGKIIMANSAACRLLGYSKKEMLTKDRTSIFDINEGGFKKMLKERTAEGHSKAQVTAIKKSGRAIPCEITSAVFLDEHNIKKAITTIVDRSHAIEEQKNIDTENKKIVADDIVLAKSNQRRIDAQKEKIVSDNILRAQSNQKDIDDKTKKIVADDIVLAKSNQKKIDIKKEKIVNDNIVLEQAACEAKLEKNEKWKKYVGKTLYDVMWDWDIKANNIYAGDSIEEVFGYKLQNNRMRVSDFVSNLLPEERDEVRKKILRAIASGSKIWGDSFKFRRHDGSIASTTSRASIIRDKDGIATRLIGAIQDVSSLEELEEKLDEQITIKKENYQISLLAAKLSFDGIWDWNLLTNEFFLSEGFEGLFGQAFSDKDNIAFNWLSNLHPFDRESVKQGLKDAIASPANYWEHGYRFVRADGSIAEVFSRANIIRDADGKAYRMIGVMHDISKQKMLEERLAQEIKLKEMQIEEASEDAKDMERSEIGKELHDNVNQLLSASRLYLDMAKRGGGDTESYLSRSSEYILIAIEEIRKLTKGMVVETIKNIGLCEAIGNTARDIMETAPLKISCEFHSFIEDSLSAKFKQNAFRIMQEQLNNILKHANATEVLISLSQDKRSTILVISDNGIGFDTSKNHSGIGLANIKCRSAAYNGTAYFDSEPGQGCVLTVTFPLSEVLPE